MDSTLEKVSVDVLSRFQERYRRMPRAILQEHVTALASGELGAYMKGVDHVRTLAVNDVSEFINVVAKYAGGTHSGWHSANDRYPNGHVVGNIVLVSESPGTEARKTDPAVRTLVACEGRYEAVSRGCVALRCGYVQCLRVERHTECWYVTVTDQGMTTLMTGKLAPLDEEIIEMLCKDVRKLVLASFDGGA